MSEANTKGRCAVCNWPLHVHQPGEVCACAPIVTTPAASLEETPIGADIRIHGVLLPDFHIGKGDDARRQAFVNAVNAAAEGASDPAAVPRAERKEAAGLVLVGTVAARHVSGPERRYTIHNGALDNLEDGTYPLFALAEMPLADEDDDARKAFPTSEAPALPLTMAARDVLSERLRQVTAEGWTPEHDDTHKDQDLALAAACYALCYARPQPEWVTFGSDREPPPSWPWARGWWKPWGPRRDLVRAAALILAELERIDRAAAAARARSAIAPTTDSAMPKTCSYPDCRCPFDAPADPNWCARGYLPRPAIAAPAFGTIHFPKEV